jgi:hypothetical protein
MEITQYCIQYALWRQILVLPVSFVSVQSSYKRYDTRDMLNSDEFNEVNAMNSQIHLLVQDTFECDCLDDL